MCITLLISGALHYATRVTIYQRFKRGKTSALAVHRGSGTTVETIGVHFSEPITRAVNYDNETFENIDVHRYL